ncbi:MAG: hypothetical protein JW742_06780 [Candidatus Aminicenantes bacterium]|nr:hypothetical protein [Candidatus Aminicenantes bacterium]
MRRPAVAPLLLLTVGLAVASGLAAQEAAPNKAPSPFKLSFSERIRQESSDNVTSLNETAADSSAYLRFRTSLGLQWFASPRVEFALKLTNESRYYIAPKSDPRIKTNFDVHEVFFDQLYLRWKRPADLPLTLTLGRQNIQLGEGFIILDGGPLDGSRSAYFNAVRLDYAAGAETTLTAFYLNQPRTDTLLPVVNDLSQAMIEQDEEGFGLYASGPFGKLGWEAYLFRKSIRRTGALPGSGFWNAGGRLQSPFGARLSLTTEAAFQSGAYSKIDRIGYGGYFHFDYKTQAAPPWPTVLTLGGVYLSGDDPATTDRYEAWDPAFSRWPKWSDSLIYLSARESRPAYWSNFTSLYGTLNFALRDNLRLLLTVHRLGAAQKTPATSFLSGAGMDRGNLFLARLNFDISKNVSGHVLWESLRPGDYYFRGAQSYAWVRFEIIFRY